MLKDAIVVPVYKSGNNADMTNYRPIAFPLSVFSKIFEILVKEKILSFLLKHNFFSNRQYGFLSGKCIDNALIDQVTEITQNLEINKQVAAVFLDITKAFVRHS